MKQNKNLPSCDGERAVYLEKHNYNAIQFYYIFPFILAWLSDAAVSWARKK